MNIKSAQAWLLRKPRPEARGVFPRREALDQPERCSSFGPAGRSGIMSKWMDRVRLPFLAGMLLVSAPAFADLRTYGGNSSLGQVTAQLLAAFEKDGSFAVRRVYERAQDGKSGLVLSSRRGTIAEILFVEKGPREVQLAVKTQDESDSRLFHKLLVTEMKLRELGVVEPPEDTHTWPAP